MLENHPFIDDVAMKTAFIYTYIYIGGSWIFHCHVRLPEETDLLAAILNSVVAC